MQPFRQTCLTESRTHGLDEHRSGCVYSSSKDHFVQTLHDNFDLKYWRTTHHRANGGPDSEGV